MNDIHKKLQIAMLAAFLTVLGVWIVTRRPDLLPSYLPGPSYANFEAAADSAGRTVIKVEGIGYGVIVHPRGYFLTVGPITQESKLTVTVPGGEVFDAEIVLTDSKTEFILAKIMAEREFDAARLNYTAEVSEGDLLCAATDTGLAVSRVYTVSDPLGKKIHVDLDPAVLTVGLPLFDSHGEIVAICVGRSSVDSATADALAVSLAADLITSMEQFAPVMTQSAEGVSRIEWMGARLLPRAELTGTSLLVEEITYSHPRGAVWQSSNIKAGDKIIAINGVPIDGLLSLEKTLPHLARNEKVSLLTVGPEGVRQAVFQFGGSGTWMPRMSFVPMLLVVVVFFITYYLVYRNWIDRTIIFPAAAVSLTVLGHHLGFYDWTQAWAALETKLDVICFIVGMNILTIVLEEGGLFSYLAKRIVLLTRGDGWKIMLSFCVLTYVFSLFVNNLTTIMVLVPMVFRLSCYLGFDPKPYMIAMVISSNLGGASTMVGDFPNMLIGTETGIAFAQFVKYMMPVCLIELVLLLVYMRLSHRSLFKKSKLTQEVDVLEEMPQIAELYGNNIKKTRQDEIFGKIKQQLKAGLKNSRAVKRGMLILVVLVAAFMASDYLSVSPALLALAAGFTALFACGIDKLRIFERINYKDIIFFSSLFVLVGAAEASGFLNMLGEAIVHLSFGNVLARSLLLMWIAGIITAVLNAGPSTALFLPLVMGFEPYCPDHIYFWSLSLGVLAGSSATLTGATAGSVTSNMFNEYLATRPSSSATPAGELSFREYAKIGIPISVCFLIISSIYITLIYTY